MAVQSLIKFFFYKPQEPTSAEIPLMSEIDGIPTFNRDYIKNVLSVGDEFEFSTYLSFMPPFQFYKNIANKTPVWSESGLFYNYSESNLRDVNLTVPVNKGLL
mmetsp:Transcript_35459/g.34499  ORF Transcript_35459/g.34499 Transcript_35459/m.34499 type:complete len:103 (+) Transcript_35459:84-392(+)